VLYDKATKKFKQVDVKERHDLNKKLELNYEKDALGNEQTMFTAYDAKTKQYTLKEGRPVFILSSTSYTPDENFGTMVSALDKL
jgi:hypothetical protein